MALADYGKQAVTMQTLDIHRPEMPELQFVLLVTAALCTSTDRAKHTYLRTVLFDRCWVLIHDSPPPRRLEARVLDLRPWTEIAVEAMAETIRAGLTEAGSSPWPGIIRRASRHRPAHRTRGLSSIDPHFMRHKRRTSERRGGR